MPEVGCRAIKKLLQGGKLLNGYPLNIATLLQYSANMTIPDLVSPVVPVMHVANGAVRLHQFLDGTRMLAELEPVLAAAPLRQMKMPHGGECMVPMSNCGDWGWSRDEFGYRYVASDPETQRPWPKMPDYFISQVQVALVAAGFAPVVPTSCLINSYSHGQQLGLPPDKDEKDHTQPIVSFSLGLPARFVIGGFTWDEHPQEILLEHEDVFVFGRESRMRFQGVLPIEEGWHSLTGPRRINLTFRVAK